ncbi:hypothetical protein Agabi119p4_6259 [Agaricus bisporus var. burnettii]|uniref:Uncharacterized protein n=1 Tax=Agaricus bisporus var. burnettii TaxID=192524 RepID=A0A8H7C8N7_AGABI|nr:hypothetical protein Agabi119p4_6259 [Agaricus bisporus var. burnettii]
MVLQKHHSVSNQKNQLLRRQVAAADPKPDTTRKAPASPILTRPTRRPNHVKPTNTTRVTPPNPVIATPTRPPQISISLSLPPPSTTESTVLPLPSVNVPISTSSSVIVTFTTSSTTSSGISDLPSESASPIVAAITSATSTPSAAATASGNISTGTLVGSIVGGCAALGLIVASVFFFLYRRHLKKKRYDEAFNSSEFRRSAVLLDGGQEKQRRHQPPTVGIARPVQNMPTQNTPIHQQNHYAPAAEYYGGERGQHDDPFRAQAPYGTAYPGAHSSRPAYAYPPDANTYGYNNSHDYPPPGHYPPRPQCVTQQYDAAPSPSHYTHSEISLPYARQYDAIVNSPAHYARSETSLLPHPEPGTPSIMMAHDGASAVQSRHSTEDDEDAPPPAYEITDSSVNHKPDMKTRHLTYDAATTISGSSSVTTPAPVPVSTSAGPSTEPSSPLFTGPSRHHTLLSRPVSGTSAFTIVEMKDDHGGIV